MLMRWWPVLVLAMLTVGAYGVAFYAFGVLIEPIRAETGWSSGALSGAFSLGLLLSAGVGIVAGRVLDRVGPQPVFLGALSGGSACLLVASTATSLPVFILAWGLGAGLTGGGLFYHVTMAVTARLYYEQRPRAFALLTFGGGLASPIFFPLAGLLVELFDWRTGLRILVAVMVVFALPAVVLVRDGGGEWQEGVESAVTGGYSTIGDAIRSRQVVQMVVMIMLAMAAMSAIQVHHVPAMQAAGLSLGAASAIAAVRGLLSLPGRAGLALVVGRVGTAGALIVVYGMTVLGIVALATAGPLALVWAFAVLTGLAFGTISPLHGLLATEVYGRRRLGTLLGAQEAIVGVASASGPLMLGLVVDGTGSYRLALVPATIAVVAAMLLLAARPRTA